MNASAALLPMPGGAPRGSRLLAGLLIACMFLLLGLGIGVFAARRGAASPSYPCVSCKPGCLCPRMDGAARCFCPR